MTDQVFTNVYLVLQIIQNDPEIWFKMVQVSKKFAKWSTTSAAKGTINELKTIVQAKKTVLWRIDFPALRHLQAMSGQMTDLRFST